MPPEILRGGFRIAFFVLALALIALPFEPAGTAEQIVTVMAAVVGGVFVAGIAILARMGHTPIPDDSDRTKDYNERSTSRGRGR